MIYAKKYNLGQINTSLEALKFIGADYKVRLGELKSDTIDVPMKKALIREDTNITLNVVGNRYLPTQNSEAFAFFDNICKEYNVKYNYGYIVNDGEMVLLQAKIGDNYDITNNDSISNYITLMNYHGIAKSFSVFFTPIRLVCNNQLSGAIKGAVNKVVIRATKSAPEKMKAASNIFKYSQVYFNKFKKNSRKLANTHINNFIVEDFLLNVFGEPKKRNTQEHIDIVKKLFYTGKGNTGKTAWHLYNAVTEWADHYRYNSKTNSEERNLGSAILAGQEIKEKSWNAVLKI